MLMKNFIWNISFLKPVLYYGLSIIVIFNNNGVGYWNGHLQGHNPRTRWIPAKMFNSDPNQIDPTPSERETSSWQHR